MDTQKAICSIEQQNRIDNHYLNLHLICSYDRISKQNIAIAIDHVYVNRSNKDWILILKEF